MSTIVIKGAHVIDPSQGIDGIADIVIERGVVKSVGEPTGAHAGAEVIDAKGLIAAPAFVEVHAHTREPGGEQSETIATGARAGVVGGYGRVCCMPNTRPVCDSAMIVRYMCDRSADAGLARVHPIAAVTKGLSGAELCEYSALRDAGAVAFSDDGVPVADAGVMRRAMQAIGALGMVIMDHCEDMSLTADGVMHEGAVSMRLGLPGIPRSSEASVVARDCMLSAETGCRLHICHVSTVTSVEAIREWKKRGAPVTAEVSPHHLTLTDERVWNERTGEVDTHAKMKPPLCAEEDRLALIEALEDGTIDCIATDHAPHAPALKDNVFDAAPFGILGLESAFSVLHREFVASGKWSMANLIERMTIASARILGEIGGGWGSLAAGCAGDVVLIDPERAWTLTVAGLGSKSENSPWVGERFGARVVGTIVGGRVVHRVH
ncbi:MAG: dihydroorotase [Phycisphaeraceae bacterium]|nr:dihydroorotase [Phycisphaeraceae bacterium]